MEVNTVQESKPIVPEKQEAELVKEEEPVVAEKQEASNMVLEQEPVVAKKQEESKMVQGEEPVVAEKQEASKDGGENEFAYIDELGFTSEIYKIEIRGMPKFYGAGVGKMLQLCCEL